MHRRPASRRRFLIQALGAAAGATVLLSSGWSLARAALAPRRLTDLRGEELRSLRGSRFRIRDAQGHEVGARLVIVDDHSHLTRPERIEQLSLVFRTGERQAKAQDVFELLHPELDDSPLLLVPVRHGRRGVHYEAVLSRLF